MKKRFASLVVLSVFGALVTTLFGDNIKALFGMSAEALSGHQQVSTRLERKKLSTFASQNLGSAEAPPAPSPATRTTLDALSTFGIDVDTASYTWARRTILEQRTLPPAAGIRLEEWVNAFDYTLEAPTDAPFAVSVEGAVSPFDESKTLVKVALQGRRVDEEARKPAHLVFLLDTSCSMSGADRLPLAKRALEVLTRQLRPTDTVSLVTYAGQSRVVLPPVSAGNQQQILNAIAEVNTSGGTNMGSGMELAYALAVRQVRPGTTTRVIVVTDGDANIGPNLSPAQMLESVRGHVQEGVTLTTVGVGLGNYKADALEQLADKGNGQALYLDGEAAIQRAFRQQLLGTLEVIAKDVKVQVAFDPKVVSSYRLLGYENRALADEDFRKDDVDAGELGSGHTVTALYEVVLTSASGALGSVAVRGQLPDSTQVFEVSAPITRKAVEGPLAERSSDFRFAAAVALGADVLRGNELSQWSLAAIAELAAGAADARGDREEFVRLLRTADGLKSGRIARRMVDLDGY